MDNVCIECYQTIDSCTCTYYDLNEELYIQPKYKKGISCILITVDELNKYKKESEQLKEALRKCIPLKIDAYMDLEGECCFCGVKQFLDFSGDMIHSFDCEYVKLIQESEDK